MSYSTRFNRLPLLVKLGIALGVTVAVGKVWEKV